jgi:hypothetical protein
VPRLCRPDRILPPTVMTCVLTLESVKVKEGLTHHGRFVVESYKMPASAAAFAVSHARRLSHYTMQALAHARQLMNSLPVLFSTAEEVGRLRNSFIASRVFDSSSCARVTVQHLLRASEQNSGEVFDEHDLDGYGIDVPTLAGLRLWQRVAQISRSAPEVIGFVEWIF